MLRKHIHPSEMKDFEGAVQVACAKRIGADDIVTGHVKDFEKSEIKVLTPSQAVDLCMGSK